MQIQLFSSILLTAIVTARGLKCWTCDNARSNQDCIRRGRTRICQNNQRACQTEVRTDANGLRITKRCKQAMACENNFLQNRRADWTPSQCNLRRVNSVCRCCCSFDECNKDRLKCLDVRNDPPQKCQRLGALESGSKTCTSRSETKLGTVCRFSCDDGYVLVGWRTSRCVQHRTSKLARFSHQTPLCRAEIRCKDQGSLEHGEKICTNGTSVGSNCTFTCTEENYSIFPTYYDENICLHGGQWSMPKPCCLRKCPPFAMMDVIIIMDSSSSMGIDNWRTMKTFVKNIIDSFSIGDDASKIAVYRYNSFVDEDTQVLLNFYSTKADLIRMFNNIPYNGRGTNTGRALLHAKDIALLPEAGNRPEAKDALLVITDGISQDEVKRVSQDLRKDGVMTFALGIAQSNRLLNRSQLLDIAGSEDNLLVAESGFSGLDLTFSTKLSSKICGNKCIDRYRDEL